MIFSRITRSKIPRIFIALGGIVWLSAACANINPLDRSISMAELATNTPSRNIFATPTTVQRIYRDPLLAFFATFPKDWTVADAHPGCCVTVSSGNPDISVDISGEDDFLQAHHINSLDAWVALDQLTNVKHVDTQSNVSAVKGDLPVPAYGGEADTRTVYLFMTNQNHGLEADLYCSTAALSVNAVCEDIAESIRFYVSDP